MSRSFGKHEVEVEMDDGERVTVFVYMMSPEDPRMRSALTEGYWNTVVEEYADWEIDPASLIAARERS